MTVNMTRAMQNGKTNKIWDRHDNTYLPSSDSAATKLLPPGIYNFQAMPDRWWLERTASRFVFPYKIYGSQDAIIDRIKHAWATLPGNIGVLLNGLKGTGKTITAQQIVNWAIDEGMVVLNAQRPVPLAMIMDKVEQPMLILYDEFEKTHDEKQHQGAQQQMLSAMDGLSRGLHRRLFVFTTNTRAVNENFIDRPSRIRYHWEFGRMAIDVIEALLDDLLDFELVHLRSEVISYLNSREVLTFDVAKAVIMECNAFRQGPETFKACMNLTERAPTAYKLEIVHSDGRLTNIASYFRSTSSQWLAALLSKSGQQRYLNENVANDFAQTIHSTVGQSITFLGPTDKVDEWMCHVQLPTDETWVGKALSFRARKSLEPYLWLDQKPADWKTPSWAPKLSRDNDQVELTDEESEHHAEWEESSSVYGTDEKQAVRLRFTMDREPVKYDAYKSYDF